MINRVLKERRLALKLSQKELGEAATIKIFLQIYSFVFTRFLKFLHILFKNTHFLC